MKAYLPMEERELNLTLCSAEYSDKGEFNPKVVALLI